MATSWQTPAFEYDLKIFLQLVFNETAVGRLPRKIAWCDLIAIGFSPFGIRMLQAQSQKARYARSATRVSKLLRRFVALHAVKLISITY